MKEDNSDKQKPDKARGLKQPSINLNLKDLD